MSSPCVRWVGFEFEHIYTHGALYLCSFQCANYVAFSSNSFALFIDRVEKGSNMSPRTSLRGRAIQFRYVSHIVLPIVNYRP